MKRLLGFGLAGVLAIGVILALALGGKGGGKGGDDPTGPGGTTSPGAGDTIALRGLIGSEKKPYFDDPRVQEALRKHGLTVSVDTAGSRDIASRDLSGYAFVFPSSAPAGERIKRLQPKNTGVYAPFYSPMAIATFTPIVELLEKQGIVTNAGGAKTFDIAAYLTAVDEGLTWKQIKGNTTYPASKSVLLTTTDVRKSNSSGMFLALASYAANGGKVVASREQAGAVSPLMAKVFLGQGFSESSSEAPFENYLAMGMGGTPMVVVYESQFLGRQIAKDGSITDDRVLLYPTPGMLSKHTLIALDGPGRTLGEALTSDPELARLAAEHGFRTQSPQVFSQVLADAGVAEPPQLVDVVDPPSYENLELMIVDLENRY